jgi:hypothetical protein
MTKLLILTASLLAFASTSAAQQQQYYDFNKRGGKWEVMFVLQQNDDYTLDFNKDVSADIKDQLGWGFQFGYNLDQHWNFSFAFDVANPDYRTRGLVDENLQPTDFTHESDTFSGQFNGTYHFMAGRFTPYLEAGLGWTYTDSNVSDGRYYYTCSPYYPFYCGYGSESYDDSSFSYHTGVGIRYEFGNKLFVKAGIARRWIDMSKASGTPEQDYARFEIGTLL